MRDVTVHLVAVTVLPAVMSLAASHFCLFSARTVVLCGAMTVNNAQRYRRINIVLMYCHMPADDKWWTGCSDSNASRLVGTGWRVMASVATPLRLGL